MMQDLGYGKDYVYDHDTDEGFSGQNYFPDGMARPALYRIAVRTAMGVLGRLGRKRGRFSHLPLAGGWTKHRDLPAPSPRTFMDQWRSQEKNRRQAA